MTALFTLDHADLRLTVDARLGARIVEFSIKGRNCLAESGPHIGSTFWPSPQQAWHWPPPQALDSNPYHLLPNTHGGLHLQSDPCAQTGLQIAKTFQLSGRQATVIYRLTNCTDAVQRWAPWEISRIYGGISFYQSEAPVESHSSAPVTYRAGVVWHEYRPEHQTAHEKLFGNASAGWVANVHQGLLLVKRFAPIASAEMVAPGEAEVEVYAHGDGLDHYIELEQQGAYVNLQPGASIDWQVQWLLTVVPGDCDCTVGSADLIALVAAMLANA